MTCGIYAVTHRETGRVYVGQSVRIERRWADHKRQAASLVGKAIQKYGSEAFDFRVLVECEVALLDELETFWVAQLEALHPRGFNLTTGGRQAPIAVSEPTREKLRQAKLGSKQSAESRAKTSAGLKGKPKSEQARANMRAAALKRFKPKPPEAKKRLLEPEERRAITSKALRDSYERRRAENPAALKRPSWTPERRAKTVASHLARAKSRSGHCVKVTS